MDKEKQSADSMRRKIKQHGYKAKYVQEVWSRVRQLELELAEWNKLKDDIDKVLNRKTDRSLTSRIY